MRRLLRTATIFCLLAKAVSAIPSPLAPPPGEQCRTAILAAERGHAIPPQLLAAIGRVESGKKDPNTGTWNAWPWTINAEGQGSWFDSKVEVITAVRALQARGVRSIDVGCMQVNLMHHPSAFATLDLAFEPAVNADYAARFLTELHEQTGDWMKAAAAYHSSNPAEGEPYAAKVAAFWPEEQRKASLALPFTTSQASMFTNAATPFPTHQPPRILAAAPSAQPGAIVGHSLSFYQATPIRLFTRLPVVRRIPFLAAPR